MRGWTVRKRSAGSQPLEHEGEQRQRIGLMNSRDTRPHPWVYIEAWVQSAAKWFSREERAHERCGSPHHAVWSPNNGSELELCKTESSVSITLGAEISEPTGGYARAFPRGGGHPEGVASAPPQRAQHPFGVIDRHFVDDKRGSGVPRLWAYVSISPATATVCTPEG